MAWNWDKKTSTITMDAGDFGVGLSCDVKGMTLTATDCLRFRLQDVLTGETLVQKDFTNIQSNHLELVLTKADSDLLPRGIYAYTWEWFQNNILQYALISNAVFRVV